MSEKRDLAIVGLLLGLLGGALVLSHTVDLGRFANITVASLVAEAVDLILGIAVLLGALLIYRARYSTGGILNLILGIIILVQGPDALGGVLALISGIVGLLANEARH